MHFQGKELISKGTTFTARSLLTVCFLKLFVYKFGIAFDEANIVGVPIGEADLGYATNILIYFLLVSHIISWIGDFLSFRNWNVSEKLIGSTTFEGAGSSRALSSKLDSGIEALTLLKDHAEANLGTANRERLEIISKQTKDAINDLSNIKGGLRNLNFFANFVLYFWYLLFPLAISVFSASVVIEAIKTGVLDS